MNQRNDIVFVYSEPLTESGFEFKAQLLAKIAEDSNKEYWRMKRLNPGHGAPIIINRWVKK